MSSRKSWPTNPNWLPHSAHDDAQRTSVRSCSRLLGEWHGVDQRDLPVAAPASEDDRCRGGDRLMLPVQGVRLIQDEGDQAGITPHVLLNVGHPRADV